jgi:hypothetical protein
MVFALASTWAKLLRERGWRRPRQRVHPPKPTVGVRASQPNQIWHIDTSVIKLLDSTKVYLQAVLDNCSRKILAWTVTERFDPSNTCQVLLAAGKHLLVNDKCAYWTNKHAIMRVRLDGEAPTSPEVVADDDNYRGGTIATDGRFLYWQNLKNAAFVRVGRDPRAVPPRS